MRWLLIAALAALPFGASALTVAQTLPAGSIIAAGDLIADTPGENPDAMIGMQARVTLYQGRPVLAGQLRAPQLVQRNKLVPVLWQRGGLSITTEARALEPGAEGDRIRLMNLDTKTTITGTVAANGTVIVSLPENRP
ncbi:MAG: flagellar basal body P-ring formation chaperone FlgA [Paracoccus sp. (in: a-proteobacteria)]|uniref:flagellar basal body P-ring formation chaperone FlgA n=1 Tax=Paracoccus sp. TaxID=267 RepID=UPI0026E07584|nr:flagellar basal body P-ring formation chaperone FlgA [Paracoccus sp. (in: a-proteobacteria)]MDO5621235.1 flagellar basal body P-ring formation chaperone FlgA [Paracoccus sp. (in: a-proteobacteria)]